MKEQRENCSKIEEGKNVHAHTSWYMQHDHCAAISDVIKNIYPLLCSIIYFKTLHFRFYASNTGLNLGLFV